jgi:hypothetical protein
MPAKPALLPDGLGAMGEDRRVPGHDREPLDFGLSDQQPVEGVTEGAEQRLLGASERIPCLGGETRVVLQPPQRRVGVDKKSQSSIPRARAMSSGQTSKSSASSIRQSLAKLANHCIYVQSWVAMRLAMPAISVTMAPPAK